MDRFLSLFVIFGHNFGSSELFKNRKIASFVCIAHILLASYYSIYLIHIIVLASGVRRIHVINAALIYVTTLFAYWFAISDSIIYRREQRFFWKVINKINKSCSCELTHKFFIIKFATYILITILSLLFDVSINGDIRSIFLIILVRICEFRMFYYIFHVELLHSHLKIVEDQLKQNERKTRICVESSVFERIRAHYNCIHAMTGYLNKAFGLSQVTGISYCFYTILTNMNILLVHYNELPVLNNVGELKGNFFVN